MVLTVILFADIIRFRLLAVPLSRDEGEYAYAGQLILQGIPPYELAYNMKLPGTYLAYALGMGVFGQSIAGIHLTLLLVNNLTIVFTFLLGRRLFGNVAGVGACVSYAVMTLSPAVAGLSADANHFVVLFAVPAVLLLLKVDKTVGWKIIFGSGLLFGLAFLMKQQGICFGLFGLVFLFWTAARKRKLLSGLFAGKMLAFGSGLALPFALTCLWLAIAGVFGKFWFWTVIYARTYEGEMQVKAGIHDYLFDHLQQTRDLSIGFWALTLVGLVAACFQRTFRRPMLFTVTFWLFSFLGTAAGLYFRGHYFILVLPAFALLVGMSVAALQSACRFARHSDVFKSLPVMAFGLAVSWMIYYQSQPLFQWPAIQFCRGSYLQNPSIEAIAVAKLLRENSAATARVAVMGSEPEIYFYAQRHSATGYIYTYALMERQPYALTMQHEMIREIEMNKPEYLVYVDYGLSWLSKLDSDRTIFDWFTQYSARFYDRIGVVGERSDGKPVSLWDETAENYQKPPGQYLEVFRRKAGLKNDSSRTD